MSESAGARATPDPGLSYVAPQQLFTDPAAEERWRARVTGQHVRLPRSARDNPARSLYSSNRTGTYELWLWNRDTDQHRQVTARESGTELGELSADGHLLWWFADTGGNEFGHWVHQLVDEPSTAVHAAPEAGDGVASGIALGPGLAVFGLATDRGITVWRKFNNQDAEPIYQHPQDGLVGQLSADASTVVLRHSEHGDASTPGMRVVDVSTGASVAELRDEGKRLVPLGFAPIAGDPRLLAVHERRGRDELLIWDTVTGSQIELSIDLPGHLEARWLPDGGALLVLHSHAARVTLHRYDLLSGAVELLGPEAGCVDDAVARPDGAVEYSWSSSGSAPRVLRWDAGITTTLFPEPDVMPPDSVPMVDEWVPGPGGPIHVLIFRPGHDIDGPQRTMFWLHGGPFVDDRDIYSPRKAAWVDAGWTVVSLNYRGSTGYGAAWRQSIVGNPGLTEIADLDAVHDWCVRSGISDPDTCVVEGYSWGGYLALLAAACSPHRWRAVVAGLPITDHALAYEDAPEPLRAMARSLFGGAPDEVPEKYVAASPLHRAADITAPVLIIAGRNDPRCPIRQIDAFAQRLTELGRPPAVYRYDGGHGTQVSGTVEEFLRVAITFAGAAASKPTHPAADGYPPA